MKAAHVAIVVAVLISLSGISISAERSDRVLSRHRRYLVFPEGSTFNAAFCMSNKARVHGDSGIFTEGVAWGASYDLPNNTQAIASLGAGAEPLDVRRRRDRRDLYRKMEVAVDSAGLSGRPCILRAVCEAQQLLTPGRTDVVRELLRVILTMPAGRLSPREPGEHAEYVAARWNGEHGADCAELYWDCPVSLLALAISLTPTKL